MKAVVPQEFKDASVIHLYKRKGNRSQSDNDRGTSFLLIAGKILARVVLNRFTAEAIERLYPELQCSFRCKRCMADMVFAFRHLLEKCKCEILLSSELFMAAKRAAYSTMVTSLSLSASRTEPSRAACWLQHCSALCLHTFGMHSFGVYVQ